MKSFVFDDGLDTGDFDFGDFDTREVVAFGDLLWGDLLSLVLADLVRVEDWGDFERAVLAEDFNSFLLDRGEVFLSGADVFELFEDLWRELRLRSADDGFCCEAEAVSA